MTTTSKDGCFSWFVATAAFCSQFFGIGHSFGSIGVLTVEFGRQFPNASEDDLAWIGSLRVCFVFMGGVAAVALSDKLSYRFMTVTGGAIAALGIGLGCLATQLWHVYLTVGIVTGIGVSFVNTASSVVVEGFFDKWLHAAFAFTYLGACSGAAAFGSLTEYIMGGLGLRDTLLTLAGMMGVHLLCALAFRPIDKSAPISAISVELTDQTLPKDGKRGDAAESVTTCNVMIENVMQLELRGTDCETQTRDKSAAQEIVEMKVIHRHSTQLQKLLTLISQWKVWLLFVTFFLWEYTDSACFALLPTHAERIKLSESDAALGISMIGIGNVVGNALLIPLAALKYNQALLFACALLTTGALGMLYPVAESALAYCALSVVFGLCQGFFIGLIMSVISGLAGKDCVVTLLGFTNVACGIGGLVGPVVTGENARRKWKSFAQARADFSLYSRFCFHFRSIARRVWRRCGVVCERQHVRSGIFCSPAGGSGPEDML